MSYFVEHLRDIQRESCAKAHEGFMREVTRQLMMVMDQVPRAKENLRQQARDLHKRVMYCFHIDLEDINDRYSSLGVPDEFYRELQTIRTALSHEFPGMEVSFSTTQNTVIYTVSADL